MATPTTLPAAFTAGQVLTAAEMNDLRGAFRVLQVVQTLKTDTFSTTSTSYVDITGLNVSITPSATSSKVLVIVNLGCGTNNVLTASAQLVRDSTPIGLGDAASSRTRATKAATAAQFRNVDLGMCVLDSPNTTSATTYKVQMLVSGNTATINTSSDDSNAAGTGRFSATITALEISA
jgi:hypothetical protein